MTPRQRSSSATTPTPRPVSGSSCAAGPSSKRLDPLVSRAVGLQHLLNALRYGHGLVEAPLPHVAAENEPGDAGIHRHTRFMDQVFIADLAPARDEHERAACRAHDFLNRVLFR